MSIKELEIYIDGASKGNPGPSGIGIVICRDGEVLKNIFSFIGETTNNVAEYTALLFALEEALILKADRLVVKTDSQLLARQINGSYRVKNPNLYGIFNRVMCLINSFKEFKIQEVSRQDNKGADKLATKAIREFFKKQVGRTQPPRFNGKESPGSLRKA